MKNNNKFDLKKYQTIDSSKIYGGEDAKTPKGNVATVSSDCCVCGRQRDCSTLSGFFAWLDDKVCGDCSC